MQVDRVSGLVAIRCNSQGEIIETKPYVWGEEIGREWGIVNRDIVFPCDALEIMAGCDEDGPFNYFARKLTEDSTREDH